jgi:hypothetical protein
MEPKGNGLLHGFDFMGEVMSRFAAAGNSQEYQPHSGTKEKIRQELGANSWSICF